MPASYVYKGEPPKLDLDTMKGNQVATWKKQWMAYVDASGLSNESETRKINVLYQCLTAPTLEKLETLAPNAFTLTAVVDALVKYGKGQVSLILERKRFVERQQQPDESAYDFSIALKQQLSKCSFDQSNHDALLATFFVVGLRDALTIETILAMDDPTFDQAVAVAKSREAASRTRQGVKEGGDQTASVNRTSVDKKQGNRSSSGTTTSGQSCPWCGSSTRHTRTTCPAASGTCRSCNKKGHYARVCRSTQANQNQDGGQHRSQDGGSHRPHADTRHNRFQGASRQLSIEQTQQQIAQLQLQLQQQQHSHNQYEDDQQWLHHDPSVAHIFAITVNNTESGGAVEKAPRMEVECSWGPVKRMVCALPDTGADVSAAGLGFLDEMGVRIDQLEVSTLKPRAADGTPMKVLGALSVTWKTQEKVANDRVYIIEGTESVLLSWKAVRDLGLLSKAYPEQAGSDEAAVATVNTDDSEEHEGEIGKQARVLGNKLVHNYSDVFDKHIKVMKGEDFKIELRPDAEPRAVRTARPVPLPMREGLRRELRSLQERDIIEPVTRPSDWCSPVVLEPKSNGDVRLCVDMTHPNRYVKRELYLSDPPHTLVSTIPRTAKFFTTMDATKGYHQCMLHPESRHYTTFITPFGRYQYKRAPFGLSSISEHYNRRMDEALEGLDGYRRTTDDVLTYDDELYQHYLHVKSMLDRCRQQNITLSLEKFKFGKKSIKFAGYMITQGSYHLHHDITNAIKAFPTPKSRKHLRSFLGLINQLSTSTDSIARLAKDLRPLLSTKNEFQWTPDHQEAFEKARAALSHTETLMYFDPKLRVRLTTDASRVGLGFVMQQPSDGQWKVVQAGSRMLTGPESRYAIIELELLAVCFALRKTELYVKGSDRVIEIRTDHKPLVTIINEKGMYDVENPRLRRMKEFLMQYQLRAEYVPGKANEAADALSRSPVEPPQASTYVSAVQMSANYLMPNDGTKREQALRQAAQSDDQYMQLLTLIKETGFPATRQQTPEELRQFWPVRNEISVHDDILFMGSRVLVPQPLRRQVLHTLHSGHQGMSKLQAKARATVYWPSIDREITDIVSNCEQCLHMRPQQQKQPMVQHARPTGPGQHHAADLFEVRGSQFLAVTDVYATWTEIAALPITTSMAVAKAMDEIWARLGLPDVLYSDGGPQFVSRAMNDLLQKKHIRHIYSAPAYPQSNGHAEAAVKTAKALIKKCWGPNGLDQHALSMGLRQQRNTPSIRDGLSPAQKMFGRQLRDEATFLAPRAVTLEEKQRAVKKAASYDEATKERYDKTAKTLPTLHIGDRALIWNHRSHSFQTKAIVLSIDFRRVTLRTQTGVVQRDRRHVLRIPSQSGRCQSQEVSSSGSLMRTWETLAPSTSWNQVHPRQQGPHASNPPTRERPQAHRPHDSHKAQRDADKQQGEAECITHTHRQPSGGLCRDDGGEVGEQRTEPEGQWSETAQREAVAQDQLQPIVLKNTEMGWKIAQEEEDDDEDPQSSLLSAPKKTKTRTQMRQESRQREQQRRKEAQDNAREKRPGEPRSITEAFQDAIETVRRSARERRPPERWADQMSE